MAGTMDELLKELNYDFNYLLHEVRAASRNLNLESRRTVEAWIQKLSATNQSMEEVRLRNDFLFYLARSCEEGTLMPPFDQRPPSGYVLNSSHLMPMLGTEMTASTSTRPIYEAYSGPAASAGQSQKAELFKRSPDGGAFLVSQPVPRCGAFCYLAVVSKQPK
ncbi:uncharacterized protein LOC115263394 [Aedes albopictus]|uniref:DUF4485 domain-containing protein n=2 Tax=Aedes albopictus TaxID=7160 RepID=A0ABM2A3R3_AEDAL|nr:uncharacterized protein LOC109429527 [Aedes albopictus]